VADARSERGLLDTSVVVDLDLLAPTDLPLELAISTVTLAELAVGPLVATDAAERARRQDRLQRAEATFESLPLDTSVARAYGRAYAAVDATGRSPRTRALDLLIAATAMVAEIPLYTRNPDDFAGLDALVEIVAI
jgi:predicted nucleic acid-binding protein